MRITVEELFEFADYVKCWWESADAELDEKTASLRMEVEFLTEERNEANAKVDELEEEVKSTTALWDWRKKLSERLEKENQEQAENITLLHSEIYNLKHPEPEVTNED